MELVGVYGSPYVRRVAVTAQYLGVERNHRPLSIFRHYDEFRSVNPMVKVPTLSFYDGSIMVESTLIIGYLETLSENRRNLMPADPENRRLAWQYIGPSLVAMEKAAQIVYETSQRPEDKQYAPWKERLVEQLMSALDLMERAATGADPWIFDEDISQADISIAIGWAFLNSVSLDRFDLPACPALSRLSDRAEAEPQFLACPA